jgi:hypothetical protein
MTIDLIDDMNEEVGTMNKIPDTVDPKQQELIKMFITKSPNCDNLIALATNKPWIDLKMINENTLEITATELRQRDNIINAGNPTAKYMRDIGKELYEMLNKDKNFSINIETFVWRDYIMERIKNWPKSDIGEWIEAWCESRSDRAKQWIVKPNLDLPYLANAPIQIKGWTSVSDTKNLTYTITFESNK